MPRGSHNKYIYFPIVEITFDVERSWFRGLCDFPFVLTCEIQTPIESSLTSPLHFRRRRTRQDWLSTFSSAHSPPTRTTVLVVAGDVEGDTVFV